MTEEEALKQHAKAVVEENKAIEERNKHIDAQTEVLAKTKTALADAITEVDLPANFFEVLTKETAVNPKQDKLNEIVHNGNKILRENGLSNFEVRITDDAYRWANDETRSIDEFKAVEPTEISE